MRDNMKPSSSDQSEFGFQIAKSNGHKILTLSGEIDAYATPKFRIAMSKILDGDEQNFIINMQNIRFMDISGLGILVSAMKRISPNGGTVNLVGCQPSIERILHMTRLSTIIALHPNMEVALNTISG